MIVVLFIKGSYKLHYYIYFHDFYDSYFAHFFFIFVSYFLSFFRRDNNSEKSKKTENKIMLPISGNILLYDMSISLHSERLRIIYDSSVIETETLGKNLESGNSHSSKVTM